MNNNEKQAAQKIGNYMRNARLEKKLTQQTIARALGITQGALSKIENGKLMPSALEWFEFCRTLQIPADSIAHVLFHSRRGSRS